MNALVNDDLYFKLRQTTGQIVDEFEQVIKQYEEILAQDQIKITERIPEINDISFDRIREKMNSQLMNIVVCGEFSSGKSFLISGLINRITWYPIKNEGFMQEIRNGYAPFLPASPQETNNCLLTLQPSQLSTKRSHFEVMFDDTKIWESRSEPYKDETDIHRLMLAYATAFEEYRNARITQDLSRTVSKVRVHIPDMPFPAYINDLPGIGGVSEENYIKMVHEAVQKADAVIYVASAIKPLTKAEFNLLGFVEDVVTSNRCPVFFVLSQIDREEKYEQVLKQNNKFLKDSFSSKAFSKQTFIPVSPATEAKAQTNYKEGGITEDVRDKGIKESGMLVLRQRLTEYLVNTSGPTHLREIILQTHTILNSLNLHVASRVDSLSTPIQESEQKLKELNSLITKLMSKRETITEELNKNGASAILEAFSTIKADNLLVLLKDKLIPMIEKQNVLDEKVRHEIDQKKKEIRDQWLYKDNGPEAAWNKAWSGYQKETIVLLKNRLEEAFEEAEIKGTSLAQFIRDQTLPNEEIGTDFDDAVETMSSSWKTILSIASIGAGGYAGLAATAGTVVVGGIAIAATPLAILFVASGLFGFGLNYWKRKISQKKLRAYMIDEYLPAYADWVYERMEAKAKEFVEKSQGKVIGIIRNLILSQQDSIKTIELELEEGDLKRKSEKLIEADSVLKRCSTLEKQIKDFYSSLPTGLRI